MKIKPILLFLTLMSIGNCLTIHNYSTHGNITEVKRLVEIEKVDVNSRDDRRTTAVQRASRAGHIDIVKYLVSKGADVNLKDFEGYTALHEAALNGHLEIVKYLIENKADINAKADYGGTPLIDSANRESCLEITKYLVSKGADVNVKDKKGLTALDYAEKKNAKNTAEFLKSVKSRK